MDIVQLDRTVRADGLSFEGWLYGKILRGYQRQAEQVRYFHTQNSNYEAEYATLQTHKPCKPLIIQGD